jgi:hypothetical protein
MSAIIHGAAIFSACGKYRYRLERDFASGRYTITVVMLNPSKAGATETDHTIVDLATLDHFIGERRVCEFAPDHVFAQRRDQLTQELPRVAAIEQHT